MDSAKGHELLQWLIKAQHDLRSARRLLTDDPPLLDTAAYHCQQAAEKALKAFLSLHDTPIPKTHLLVTLVAQCAELAPSFAGLFEAAEFLTPFATSFRYPGDVLEPELIDVETGLGLAEQVVAVVLDAMPADVRRAARLHA